MARKVYFKGVEVTKEELQTALAKFNEPKAGDIVTLSGDAVLQRRFLMLDKKMQELLREKYPATHPNSVFVHLVDGSGSAFRDMIYAHPLKELIVEAGA